MSQQEDLTELRVKVAELCPALFGIGETYSGGDKLTKYVFWRDHGEEIREREWLNACSEFEKMLSQEQRHLYGRKLSEEVDCVVWLTWRISGYGITKIAHATAEQRCRAFVKVMEGTREEGDAICPEPISKRGCSAAPVVQPDSDAADRDWIRQPCRALLKVPDDDVLYGSIEGLQRQVEELMRESNEAFKLQEEIAELKKSFDIQRDNYIELYEELRNIATADIRKWDKGCNTADDFMKWAQSRARFTLEALASTPKVESEENKALDL